MPQTSGRQQNNPLGAARHAPTGSPTLLPHALAGRPISLGVTPTVFHPAVASPDLWIEGGSEAALERVFRHGGGWLAPQLTPTELHSRTAVLRGRAHDRGLPPPRVATMVYAAPAEQLSRIYRGGEATPAFADHLCAARP